MDNVIRNVGHARVGVVLWDVRELQSAAWWLLDQRLIALGPPTM